MSLTNDQTIARFLDGKEGRNGRGSLRSENDPDRDAEGATVLFSYGTAIAIRRADGQVFRDAHAYSVTTSQHQNGIGAGPALSFDCARQLVGRNWWQRAHVLDSGPRYCDADECRARRKRMEDEYHDFHARRRAGTLQPEETEPESPYVNYGRCWQDGEPGHALTIPDYDGWGRSATLIDFGDGTQALFGWERGKRVRFGGDTSQLWGALLPSRASDIVSAFRTLRPRVEDPFSESIKRQGDLFFLPWHGRCDCVCHMDKAPVDDEDCLGPAFARIMTRDGRYKRHGCDPMGATVPGSQPETEAFGAHVCKRALLPPSVAVAMDGLELPDKGGRHKATRAYMTADWRIWVRGYVEHPEHPRLHLAGWHRVERSRARQAVAARYSAPRGGGRAYGD